MQHRHVARDPSSSSFRPRYPGRLHFLSSSPFFFFAVLAITMALPGSGRAAKELQVAAHIPMLPKLRICGGIDWQPQFFCRSLSDFADL